MNFCWMVILFFPPYVSLGYFLCVDLILWIFLHSSLQIIPQFRYVRYHLPSLLQWRYYSGLVVSIDFFLDLSCHLVSTKFCHVSFLAFLKTLCLKALLRWNDFCFVLFVGSHWCFLYSAITIFSSLSHLSLYYVTGIFGDNMFCCL